MNESFYIIKAKEAGYLITYIPLLVILLNLIQTLSSYFFGLKIDKFGSKNILFIAFLLGLGSLIFLYFNFIIIGFILLGLFSVSSLNAIRSYISNNACNKSTVYGMFYGGIAVFSSLGSITFGIVWQHFGENIAIVFSITGISVISFIFRSILWNKS
jgi:MFS family permease